MSRLSFMNISSHLDRSSIANLLRLSCHRVPPYAGANLGSTAGGPSQRLSIFTSPTNVHDLSSVAMLKFSIPQPSSQILTAVLELTVATPPMTNVTLTIVGIAPTNFTSGGLAWTEATTSWMSASAFAVAVPSQGITSPNQNFELLTGGNQIAGHVTVLAGTPAGTVKLVEVKQYVQSCTLGPATFVISRRLRTISGGYSGNTAGVISGDALDGGQMVSFWSKESSAATAPVLRLMTGQTPPSPPPSFFLNPPPSPPNPPGLAPTLSVSAALGLGGYTQTSFGTAQQTAFVSATSMQLNVSTTQVVITAVSAVPALSNVSVGRRLSQVPASPPPGVHVRFNVSASHPTAAGAQGVARNITSTVVAMTSGPQQQQYQSSLRSNGLGSLTAVTLAELPAVRFMGALDGLSVDLSDIFKNSTAALSQDLSRLGINSTVVKQDRTAIIIGTAVGGGGVGIICLLVLCCVYCRMRKAKEAETKVIQGIPVAGGPDPYAQQGPGGGPGRSFARGGSQQDGGGYRPPDAHLQQHLNRSGAPLRPVDPYGGASPRARDGAPNPYEPRRMPDPAEDVGRGWDQAYDPNVTAAQRRQQRPPGGDAGWDAPPLTKQEAEKYLDQRSRVCGQVPVWERLGICAIQ